MWRPLILLFIVGNAHADEVCTEDKCACPGDVSLSPRAHAEVIGGLALLAAGYTLGVLAEIGTPAQPWQRPFDLIPIAGPIIAAARDSTPVDARMTELFAAGTQMVGALLLVTALLEPRLAPIEGKRVSVRPFVGPGGSGLSATVRF
jgi:hypothetical protein